MDKNSEPLETLELEPLEPLEPMEQVSSANVTNVTNHEWFSPFIQPIQQQWEQQREQQREQHQHHHQHESFTPLMSPISTPQVQLYHLSLANPAIPISSAHLDADALISASSSANHMFADFSPLNSPALLPTTNSIAVQSAPLQASQSLHDQSLQAQSQNYHHHHLNYHQATAMNINTSANFTASTNDIVNDINLSSFTLQQAAVQHQHHHHHHNFNQQNNQQNNQHNNNPYSAPNSANSTATSSHPTPTSFQMNGTHPSNGEGCVTPLTLVPLTPAQLMQLSLSSIGHPANHPGQPITRGPISNSAISHQQQQQQHQQQHQHQQQQFYDHMQQHQSISNTMSSSSISSAATGTTETTATAPPSSNATTSNSTVTSSGKKSGKKTSNYAVDVSSQSAPYSIPTRTASANSNQQPVRKVSHKEAEQKRRDNLKNCFAIVKAVLPQTGEKAPSKVQVLKIARSHILDLQHQIQQFQHNTDLLTQHIALLEARMGGMGGMQVPPRPVLDVRDRIKEENEGEMEGDNDDF